MAKWCRYEIGIILLGFGFWNAEPRCEAIASCSLDGWRIRSEEVGDYYVGCVSVHFTIANVLIY